MTEFRTPLDDIRFAMRHVADADAIAAYEAFAHADADMVDGLLEEAGRFFEEVFAPTNRDGDTVGTVWNPDGSVTTAPGFLRRTANSSKRVGPVSGFPRCTAAVVSAARWHCCAGDDHCINMALALCPLLTQGAIEALMHHGDETQKETYLQKLVSRGRGRER
jgi:hypothetical protein